MLLLRARVDLGVKAMKRYSAFPKAPAILEHLTIRLFSIISRTLVGGFVTVYRGAVGVFYSPIRLGNSRGEHIYIYIYIYIYIVIHRQICFVLSELISVAGIETRFDSNAKPKPLTIQPRAAISCEVNFKRLWITIYMYIYIYIYTHTHTHTHTHTYIYIYIYGVCINRIRH